VQESFVQAAGRHLQDAKILLRQERWDNAVYLSGYVVECSFKILVEFYFHNDQKAVKKYGHDLTELKGKAMERLRSLYPQLESHIPSVQIEETVLAQNHPERRYAKSKLWTEQEAILAVQRAEDIYQKVIPNLVLDGLISVKNI